LREPLPGSDELVKVVPSENGTSLTANDVRVATKLLGQGGDVKVEGFSSLKLAEDFDLVSISRMVAEEDGLRVAAKVIADYDPAAYLVVLANARRPVKELTDILGPAETSTITEEMLQIPEAIEVAFQHKVTVTWLEYDWLAFASVDGKIVAAKVLPMKLIESEKTKRK